MASYLSYFTSSTSNTSFANATSPLGSTASAWSNTFSSRIATLRKALTKDSEEDDPENEDCSHVSNVLRAYYIEKGRTFPEWLPPDPTKPLPAPIIQQQQPYQYGQYATNSYNAPQSDPVHGRGGSGGRGGLSDLWDPSPAPAAVVASPQSLRTARPTPQALRSQDSSHSQTNDSGLTPNFPQRGSGARPLPSQRVGSYQNSSSASQGTMGSKDRLRARLQGGGGSGRSSPAPPGSSGQPYSYGGSSGNYDSQGSGNLAYGSTAEPSRSTSGGNHYSNDSSYNSNTSSGNPYGNQNYRQRPGGPR